MSGLGATGPCPELDLGARRHPTEGAPGRGGDTGGFWNRAGDPPARHTHTQRISPPHTTGGSSVGSLMSAGDPP
ncbi:hypothetical protein NDU88_006466 [Pleurodeles waltl]|uniref:Uncharacterized protein n=1 Tax=Pleurodeles waltl TaxID=8319 RepID=A0AAV7M0A0_PLEWA|nr:hypothetical protein NDU88_006466 [Pleurodeles waltl]